jgi:hypothetical protein
MAKIKIKPTVEDILRLQAEDRADYRRRHPEAVAWSDQQVHDAVWQEIVDEEMRQEPGYGVY